MPLVQFIGGATPQDNTREIKLNPAPDGSPRSLVRGGPAVDVSGEELTQIASNYEVKVVEDSAPPLAASPTVPPSTAGPSTQTSPPSGTTGGN